MRILDLPVILRHRPELPAATSDPTESWYSPPMPRTGVDHAGALYGRVYGDPD